MQVTLSEDNIKIIIGSLNVRELQVVCKLKDYEKRLKVMQDSNYADEVLRLEKEIEIVKKYLDRIKSAQRSVAKTGVII